MAIAVYFGEIFLKEMQNFPKEDIQKIGEFVEYVASNGFSGLPGKNKRSETFAITPQTS
ncbi:hypothetical protein AAEX37_00236 [Oligella sp. MSHR50489EDL]|uniref:hypothetical protein n=1 Tax=Oligella sp. MSHR50489EDL TaxID=3139409 RepID=UPI003D8132E5